MATNIKRLLCYCAILLVSNSAMILFVVFSGEEYPHYQYSFAFLLALWSIVFYAVIHLVMFRKQNFTFLKRIWNRDCILIGFYWAVNYVFLLVSNPYTPGIVQVILNELNIVVLVLYSRLVNKRTYHWAQYVAVLLTIIGGLIPLIQSEGTATPSRIPNWAWYIFFSLGTIPIALANVRTEKILQDDQEHEISIPLFYCVINIWTLVGSLSLFWFPAIADGPIFWTNFLEGIKSIMSFRDKGSMWTWFVILMTLPSNIFTAYVSREQDATLATIVLSLAPAASGVIMGIRPIMGPYFQPAGWTIWVSLGIVLLSAFLYKGIGIWQDKKKAPEVAYVPVNDKE